MRLAPLLLIGMATIATAGAQTGPARFALLPIPHTLPTLLFAPDPLAGTLLRPLNVPSVDSTAFAEVEPVPALLPVAAATPVPDEQPAVESDPVPVLEAVPESGPAPLADPVDAAVEPVPDAPPAADIPSPTTVTVIVENVETATGTVNVAVCDKALSREGCPYVHEVPAQEGFVETEFADIPPGNYAIVGYHDVNGNDLFDKMLGIPREPYALSNNAGDKLVPTFTDAALTIKSGENAVIIRLRRLGS